MWNLILKDFKVTKKINLIFSIYVIGMSFLAIKSQAKHPGTLYIMSIVLTVYISILYANAYDEKYKVNIAFNSMPINKKNIVLSKYLSMITYLIFYFLIMFISSNLFGMILNNRYNSISIWDFVVCFNGMTLFYAIYYPFYYKMEKNKLKTFNFIVYMMFLIIPTLFTKFAKSNLGQSFIKLISKLDNVNTVHLMFLLAALIFQVISFSVSFKIYSKKEFY